MKSSVTTLESNKVKLSVEVDESEIDAAIDDAFKKIAKEIRLPGFRPGKAPRKVLEARIGREAARSEAIREVLPEYYLKAIIEHDVDVISPPDLDITSGEDSGPIEFDAVVEVRPTVTVGGYNSLRIELPALEASDDEIGAQIDALRGQFAERVEVEREAAAGDFVTMDIAGSQDGEPLEGLTAEGYTYEVGAGFIVDNLDEHLIGAKAGDIIDFDADHPDPDTDGQLSFHVVIGRIEEKQLPELDDSFAADASEFETAADLVADTKARIESMKRSQAATLIASRTATALAGLVTVDLPPALVAEALQGQMQDMAMRLASQGIRFEQFLSITGQNVDDLREAMREPAEQAARVDLALRAIAISEGLEATDDELQAEIDESAAQLQRDGADLRTALEDNGQLSAVRADMSKKKAMDWLVEQVEIVDPDGNVIDRELLVVTPDPDDEEFDEFEFDEDEQDAEFDPIDLFDEDEFDEDEFDEDDDLAMRGNTEDESVVGESTEAQIDAADAADEGDEQ